MKNLNSLSPKKAGSNHTKLRIIGFLVIILAIFTILYLLNNRGQIPILSSDARSVKVSPSPTIDPGLKAIIDPLIPSVGKYAVVIESFKDPTLRYNLNADQPTASASLYKLFVMASVLRQIDEGKLNYDSTVSSTFEHLNGVMGGPDYGYENYSGGISYTIDTCLDRIARISDNYCAIMLAEKIGWDKIAEEAKLLGATQTTFKSPITTSASDIAQFMRLTYNGNLSSATSSAKLIDYLSKSQLNNRIPAKLPEGLKIAHKTGELGSIRHDAGIVFLESNPYLIVLMSSELEGEDDAIEALSNISKAAYDYMVAK